MATSRVPINCSMFTVSVAGAERAGGPTVRDAGAGRKNRGGATAAVASPPESASVTPASNEAVAGSSPPSFSKTDAADGTVGVASSAAEPAGETAGCVGSGLS